jgi:hypothetical protein
VVETGKDSLTLGLGVAISGDGNTVIVGGPYDSAVGAAWVFTRLDGVWSQEGNKLVGNGYVGFPGQGFAVALSGDGNTAIVGGKFDNGAVGATWIFTRSNGVWSQQGSKLVARGAQGPNVQQGYTVAISADGSTALVGGPFDNNSIGAAWVFVRRQRRRGPYPRGIGSAHGGTKTGVRSAAPTSN